MTPCEVRRRTSFQDILSLIGDLITPTSSKLTWLEEWVFYLEMLSYGRTNIRWQDFGHEYGY
jgi:hypothetical protein